MRGEPTIEVVVIIVATGIAGVMVWRSAEQKCQESAVAFEGNSSKLPLLLEKRQICGLPKSNFGSNIPENLWLVFNCNYEWTG